MNVAVIKENIEDTKMRKALKIMRDNAMIDMAYALIRMEELKCSILEALD